MKNLIKITTVLVFLMIISACTHLPEREWAIGVIKSNDPIEIAEKVSKSKTQLKDMSHISTSHPFDDSYNVSTLFFHRGFTEQIPGISITTSENNPERTSDTPETYLNSEEIESIDMLVENIGALPKGHHSVSTFGNIQDIMFIYWLLEIINELPATGLDVNQYLKGDQPLVQFYFDK